MLSERAVHYFHKSFAVRVLLLVALFTLVLSTHIGACAGSSDTSGYLNDARLLALGQLHPEQRAIDGIPPERMSFMGYIPLGFLPREDGRMYPTYAMGFPLLLVLGSKLFGWVAGPNLVMGIHALACVLAMYLLGREFGLDREYSLLAATLLGSSVLFLFMSLQAMSDTPATLWSISGVLCMAKANRRYLFAALSGFFFLYGAIVRPTGVLMILPLACLLPLRVKPILAFVLGMVPGVVGVFLLNSALYGRGLTTGYGDVSQLFSASHVLPSFGAYLKWVPVELTPLVLLALGFPFLKGRMPLRQVLCLLSWIVVLFTFYSTYQYTHETWWYLRFVLPAFPALIILELHVLEALMSRLARWQWAGWIALVLMVGVWDWRATDRLNALAVGYGEKVYPETCAFLKRNIPDSSVILCMQESGAVFYYTKHPVIRWDCIDPKTFAALVEACAKGGRNIYMILFPFEEPAALKRFPGASWERVGTVRFVSIWALKTVRRS